MEALSESGATKSGVKAVRLGVYCVNHPKDQERILNWLTFHLQLIPQILAISTILVFMIPLIMNVGRDIFPSNVTLYVRNDAVVALVSGSMGKLHGYVLIAGTGSIVYGCSEDGKVAHAAGGGPVLGDWDSNQQKLQGIH